LLRPINIFSKTYLGEFRRGRPGNAFVSLKWAGVITVNVCSAVRLTSVAIITKTTRKHFHSSIAQLRNYVKRLLKDSCKLIFIMKVGD